MAREISEPEALVIFVDGLKRAAGSAHALGHYQMNLNWFKLRDMLEALIEKGQILAMSKAMPKSELEHEINLRLKNLPKDANGN